MLNTPHFLTPSALRVSDLSSSLPPMVYSRAPSLGLVLYLLKTAAGDFFQFHQSHRQSLGKLQGLDQLPPEELKEVMTARSSLKHRRSGAVCG